MYNNTISGTATEKGGNDNINTIRRLPEIGSFISICHTE
jgi:hypothetical protein